VTSDATFLAAYAKSYGAGAFATPPAKELARLDVRRWDGLGGRTVAVFTRLRRASHRRDWTGRAFVVPADSIVVTHLARTPDAAVPADLDQAHYLVTYVEDRPLTDQLRTWGRAPVARVITAAGELKAVWGPPGCAEARELPADLATMVAVDVIAPARLAQMRQELCKITGGWDDDYPFYSDGSWSALSLRGFWADPSKGVKPAEMPKAWQAEHPDALHHRCDWTSLARACPTMMDFAAGLGRLERVRLMRMAARPGGGRLARHTDITDRAAGTRDGQVMRFHLPLVSDPAVRFQTWNLHGVMADVHLAPGSVYYLDARKPHAVVNGSTVDRVHLVADVFADRAVRDLVLW
jgi:Aspartyl/Asparaginyl beta-hydroxylase